MFFIDLPLDIILYIWDCLTENKDSVNLLCTCSKMLKIGTANGYMKELSMANFSSIDFQIKSMLHKRTIQSYIVDDIDWIPRLWPEKVTIICCGKNKKIDPYDTTKTTELYINLRTDGKDSVSVNWKKFPMLKSLHISTFDINLDDLDVCTGLSDVIIHLGVINKVIPENILNIKNICIRKQQFNDFHPPDNKKYQTW